LANKYDGNIAISTTMEKHLRKQNMPVIRVPILSDIDKFKIKRQTSSYTIIQIGYTGSLTYRKDGLNELIKSIWVLINKYQCKNIVLNIYGYGYWGTIKKLEILVKKLELSKFIKFHGKVPSEEIPEIQAQQDILVLTRPQNLQTRFGFSTKLAEYMASGVVLLTTDVSDNLKYIKDEENGFIAENYLAEKVAEKLFDIIINERYLDKNIIKSAQKTASTHFNSRNYKKILFDFLFSQTNINGIIQS
jgi:glycosyltransferase involved in cell wall biosynthesis